MNVLEYFDEEYEKINSSADNINDAFQHAKSLYPKLLELCQMVGSIPTTLKYEEPVNTKFEILVESLQAVTHDLQIFIEDLSEFTDYYNKVSNSVSKIKEH